MKKHNSIPFLLVVLLIAQSALYASLYASNDDDDSEDEVTSISTKSTTKGTFRDDDDISIEAEEEVFGKTPFNIDEQEPEKYEKASLVYELGDSIFGLDFKLIMPEWFAGKNLFLLNNNNHEDRIFYIRHTIDMRVFYSYGKKSHDFEVAKFVMGIRNRGIWGDQESISSTTDSEIKAVEVLFGRHSHAIPRHIFWIRELWLEVDLNNLLGFDFSNQHYLTLGSFSFILGRGIALGDAYSVTPDIILGYSPQNQVDQYAFGAKIWGDIIKDVLGYDFYGAILNNKADSFSNTAAKVRGQEYGHKFNQVRDFAIVNFLLAGKFRWSPSIGEDVKVYLEPYWLFNDDPEQKVEFLGDASSKLATVGLSGEYEFRNFSFGFDFAHNIGNQFVKGIDRNITALENRDGFVSTINTHVNLVLNPDSSTPTVRKLPYSLTFVDENGATIKAQNVVNNTPENQNQNGLVILDNVTLQDVLVTGQLTPVPARLVNSDRRFRNPYTNKYLGSMVIFDAGYYLLNKDLQLCTAFGFATGDANPNKDLQFPGDSNVDSTYEGFVGLQEIYSGTRVRSAFFLSGAGRVPRLLDLPSQDVNDRFASTISRFTNIVFVGGSLWYKPNKSERKVLVNPNILAYWQEFATRRFDIKPEINRANASTYLGLEANVFFDVQLIKDLKFFSKTSIFLPGQHYKDVKGRPISSEQARFLDSLDQTGVTTDSVPLLGNDLALAVNFGLEYRF